MVIFFAAVSDRPSAISSIADRVLALSHRWPKIEIVLDGARLRPSELAEAYGKSCLLILHASECEVTSINSGEVRAEISPDKCLSLYSLADSPFRLNIRLTDGEMEIESDNQASIPAVATYIGGVASACSWESLIPQGVEPIKVPPSCSLKLYTSRRYEMYEKHIPYDLSLTSMDDKPRLLAELITKSVRRNVSKRCAILFSGGVDSSILVKACLDLRYEPIAIAVGLRGSHDLSSAKVAAQSLGVDYVLVELDSYEVSSAARYVSRMLGVKGVMDIAIASIIYLGSLVASRNGIRQLVAGQGADELFGGYWRYQEMVAKGELELAEQRMISDASLLWLSAVHRDYAAAALGGCMLTLPYLDPAITSFAASLGIGEKVSRTERKIVLRKAALHIGLREDLALKPKKAAQYGSKIDRVIRDMLRRG